MHGGRGGGSKLHGFKKKKTEKWNQTSGLVGDGGGGRGGRGGCSCVSRGRAGVKRDGRAAGAETKRKPQNQN